VLRQYIYSALAARHVDVAATWIDEHIVCITADFGSFLHCSAVRIE
jgi:hypothetical protein